MEIETETTQSLSKILNLLLPSANPKLENDWIRFKTKADDHIYINIDTKKITTIAPDNSTLSNEKTEFKNAAKYVKNLLEKVNPHYAYNIESSNPLNPNNNNDTLPPAVYLPTHIKYMVLNSRSSHATPHSQNTNNTTIDTSQGWLPLIKKVSHIDNLEYYCDLFSRNTYFINENQLDHPTTNNSKRSSINNINEKGSLLHPDNQEVPSQPNNHHEVPSNILILDENEIESDSWKNFYFFIRRSTNHILKLAKEQKREDHCIKILILLIEFILNFPHTLHISYSKEITKWSIPLFLSAYESVTNNLLNLLSVIKVSYNYYIPPNTGICISSITTSFFGSVHKFSIIASKLKLELNPTFEEDQIFAKILLLDDFLESSASLDTSTDNTSISPNNKSKNVLNSSDPQSRICRMGSIFVPNSLFLNKSLIQIQNESFTSDKSKLLKLNSTDDSPDTSNDESLQLKFPVLEINDTSNTNVNTPMTSNINTSATKPYTSNNPSISNTSYSYTNKDNSNPNLTPNSNSQRKLTSSSQKPYVESNIINTTNCSRSQTCNNASNSQLSPDNNKRLNTSTMKFLNEDCNFLSYDKLLNVDDVWEKKDNVGKFSELVREIIVDISSFYDELIKVINDRSNQSKETQNMGLICIHTLKDDIEKSILSIITRLKLVILHSKSILTNNDLEIWANLELKASILPLRSHYIDISFVLNTTSHTCSPKSCLNELVVSLIAIQNSLYLILMSAKSIINHDLTVRENVLDLWLHFMRIKCSEAKSTAHSKLESILIALGDKLKENVILKSDLINNKVLSVNGLSAKAHKSLYIDNNFNYYMGNPDEGQLMSLDSQILSSIDSTSNMLKQKITHGTQNIKQKSKLRKSYSVRDGSFLLQQFIRSDIENSSTSNIDHLLPNNNSRTSFNETNNNIHINDLYTLNTSNLSNKEKRSSIGLSTSSDLPPKNNTILSQPLNKDVSSINSVYNDITPRLTGETTLNPYDSAENESNIGSPNIASESTKSTYNSASSKLSNHKYKSTSSLSTDIDKNNNLSYTCSKVKDDNTDEFAMENNSYHNLPGRNDITVNRVTGVSIYRINSYHNSSPYAENEKYASIIPYIDNIHFIIRTQALHMKKQLNHYNLINKNKDSLENGNSFGFNSKGGNTVAFKKINKLLGDEAPKVHKVASYFHMFSPVKERVNSRSEINSDALGINYQLSAKHPQEINIYPCCMCIHGKSEITVSPLNGNIEALSLNALVEHLINPLQAQIDSMFERTVLTTYMTVTSTPELLKRIINVYNTITQLNKEIIQNNEQNSLITGLIKEVMDYQFKKTMTLIITLSTDGLLYIPDESTGEEVHDILNSFLQLELEKCTSDEDANFVKSVISSVGMDRILEFINATNKNKKKDPYLNIISISNEAKAVGAPTPIYRSVGFVCFENLNTLELARQFTILETNNYCQLDHFTLLNFSMEKLDRQNSDSPLSLITKTFNLITVWTSLTIMKAKNDRKRANLIKKFISLCKFCYDLNNYSTLVAVISGLNSSSVKRLKKTWAMVPLDFTNMLEDLSNIITPYKNFTYYRKITESIGNSPSVPFIGFYLTDLTFIYNGLPTFKTRKNSNDNPLYPHPDENKSKKITKDVLSVGNTSDVNPPKKTDGFMAMSLIYKEHDANEACNPSNFSLNNIFGLGHNGESTDDNLVNVKKLYKYNQVLKHVLKYQSFPCIFVPVPEIQLWLENALRNSDFNSSSLYDMSMSISS